METEKLRIFVTKNISQSLALLLVTNFLSESDLAVDVVVGRSCCFGRCRS